MITPEDFEDMAEDCANGVWIGVTVGAFIGLCLIGSVLVYLIWIFWRI